MFSKRRTGAKRRVVHRQLWSRGGNLAGAPTLPPRRSAPRAARKQAVQRQRRRRNTPKLPLSLALPKKWPEPTNRFYRMTLMRTTAGINKAETPERWMPKSGPPWRCSGYFRRRWPAISRFMARFARRQQGTGRTNCRLADVLSSAAHTRRGGVHGQQCEFSGDFVAGSIWLLLQQRWFTEQLLCAPWASDPAQRRAVLRSAGPPRAGKRLSLGVTPEPKRQGFHGVRR